MLRQEPMAAETGTNGVIFLTSVQLAVRYLPGSDRIRSSLLVAISCRQTAPGGSIDFGVGEFFPCRVGAIEFVEFFNGVVNHFINGLVLIEYLLEFQRCPGG